MRRLLFAFIIVMCKSSIVLQVGLADFLSTVLLAFYLSVMPMTDGLNNFIQIFNEVIVLISIQLLFIYSNYVDDPIIRYKLAWYFLYMMAFDCAVNVLIMLYVIARKIYCAARNAYRARS